MLEILAEQLSLLFWLWRHLPALDTMAFESGTAYPESDADDEYERSVHDSSPTLEEYSEASPTDSDPSSNEHTPTTYGKSSSGDQLPQTIIAEWTADECADFVGSLGLRQYADQFLGMLDLAMTTFSLIRVA